MADEERLNAAVDAICDEINEHGKVSKVICLDIVMHGVLDISDKLCELFTRDGEVLTCEFVSTNMTLANDMCIFCYGKTEEAHKAWVQQH
jgi:hypothetical protein